MQAISSVWASHGTARMAAMTAMIKTAHGFLIIAQTKRQLDQIHHTFDLQTTHSEQRTVVVVGKVGNEAFRISSQRLTGYAELIPVNPTAA